MKLDPKTLPEDGPCVGCGAMMRARLGPPGTRIAYHPAPVCEHMLAKIRELGIKTPEPGQSFVYTDDPRVVSN